MKKTFLKAFVIMLATCAVYSASDAQFVVKVRPAAPTVIVTRPPAPSPRHVWVDGEYVSQGGQYVYTPGRWVQPAYAGAAWVSGHWKFNRRRGGWFWVPGHWRR